MDYKFLAKKEKNKIATIRNALPLIILNFLHSYINWILLAYLPIYLKDTGMANSRIGLIIAIYSIAPLLAVIPLGVLSDRIRAGQVIQTGSILLALYPLSLLLTTSANYLFAIVLIGGIGGTAVQVSLNAAFYKTLSRHNTGKRVGMFIISGALGFSLGPFTGGIILTYLSIAEIFCLAVCLAALLFVLARNIQDTCPVTFSLKEYNKDLSKPKAWLLLISIFTTATHAGVEQASYSLLLRDALLLSNLQIGLLYGIIGLWIGALSLVSGYIFDRRRKVVGMLAGAIFLSGVFQWLTAYTSGVWGLLGVRLAHTLGDAFCLSLNGILVSLVFPGERVGGNFGVIHTVYILAVFAGAIGSGYVNSWRGYQYSFVLSGIVMMATAFFLASSRRIFSSAAGKG